MSKLRRLLRFAGVGATGVPIDLVATLLAVGIVGPIAAQAVGWVLAASWNWRWNRRLTWKSDEPWRREWAEYLTVDAGRFGARVAVVTISLYLGTGVLAATIVGIGVAASIGFLGFDQLVFTGARGASNATETTS